LNEYLIILELMTIAILKSHQVNAWKVFVIRVHLLVCTAIVMKSFEDVWVVWTLILEIHLVLHFLIQFKWHVLTIGDRAVRIRGKIIKVSIFGGGNWIFLLLFFFIKIYLASFLCSFFNGGGINRFNVLVSMAYE